MGKELISRAHARARPGSEAADACVSTAALDGLTGTARAACTAGTRPVRPASRCTPARCSPSTFHLGCPPSRPGRLLRPRRQPDLAGARGGDRRRSTAASACVFASGMAAIAAVLRLGRGAAARSCCPSDGYYVTRSLGPRRARPARRRRSARCPPPARGPPAARRRGAGAARDPVQPRASTSRDIAAAAAAAHAAGALLAVDNTTATPLGQRPLELGADLVVASDTKALAGHGDVVLGHVSTARPRAGRSACARPAPAAARSPARWRPGSPTAAWPPWTCGWPGRRRTPPRWSTCCASTPP